MVRREIDQARDRCKHIEGVVAVKEAEKEEQVKETQKVQESWSTVNRQLMVKEAELLRERELNLQLQDEKYMALTKYEGARDRNLALDKECEHLISELHSLNSRLSDASQHTDTLTS